MTSPSRGVRRLLLGLMAGYVVFLAVVLLFPRGDLPSAGVEVVTRLLVGLGADPLLVTYARVEVLGNVAIMVPLALLGRLSRPGDSWRDWTAVGFVVATAVELFQGLFLPERSATALDVVANTTGVAVGAALASFARTSKRRGEGTG